MGEALRQLPGFKGITNLRFVKGSVKVVYEAIFDAESGVDQEQIQAAIQRALSENNEKLGEYAVLPGSLTAVEVPAVQAPQKEEDDSERIRNYVIIAVACFLVLVSIIFAICLVLQMRKRRYAEQSKGYPGVQAPPYAYGYPPQDIYAGYPESYKYMGTMGSVHAAPPPMYGPDPRQYMRPYSTATTASANGKGATPSPPSGPKESQKASRKDEKGSAEVSLREWQERISNAGPDEYFLPQNADPYAPRDPYGGGRIYPYPSYARY